MDINSDNMNLKEVFFIFKKHLTLILIITIVCSALGFIVSKFIITPKYQAVATLIVNPGQNSQNNDTITYEQVNTTQQLVGTYAIILKSNKVLDKVISDLNLDTDSTKLAKNISVSGVDQTEVIQITVKDKDPDMAEKIENDIIKVAPSVIIKTVKAGSVEIISPAETDQKPVSPKVGLDTIIALCAGIFISAIVSFLIESLNNKFYSDEDVQKYLNLTVFGVIPSYDIKA